MADPCTYCFTMNGPVPTRLFQSWAPASTTSGAYRSLAQPEPRRPRHTALKYLNSTTKVYLSSAYMPTSQSGNSLVSSHPMAGAVQKRIRLNTTSSATNSRDSMTCSLPIAAHCTPGRMRKISLLEVISQSSITPPRVNSSGTLSGAVKACMFSPLGPNLSRSAVSR